MIPYAIFAGILLHEKERIELSALDLTPDGFTTRLPKQKASALFGIQKNGVSAAKTRCQEQTGTIRDTQLALRFYAYKENHYHELTLANVPAPELNERDFWTELTFTIEDSRFEREALRLLQEYNHYIQLKLTGDDEYMSREMTGYDVDELDIPESFEEQKRAWFGGKERLSLPTANTAGTLQTYGLCLDSPHRYQAYLNRSFADFYQDYLWSGFGDEEAAGSWFKEVPEDRIRYLYIGSQLCPRRVPGQALMQKLLEKALEQGRIPVVCLSYMTQSSIEEVQELLDFLEQFAKCHSTHMKDGKLEVVYNDRGMENMLRSKAHLQGQRGILLRKHRKDPRAKWKNGVSSEPDHAKDNGSVSNRDELDNAVFFPYYQTNTATYCTLYAACENGSRGRQLEVKECTYLCEQRRFLYANELRLTGYGNSLLGVQTDWLEWERNQRIQNKRFILNLI